MINKPPEMITKLIGMSNHSPALIRSRRSNVYRVKQACCRPDSTLVAAVPTSFVRAVYSVETRSFFLRISIYSLKQVFTTMLTDETSGSSSAATVANPAAKVHSTGEIQQFMAYLLRVVPLATDYSSTADVEELKRALHENPAVTESIRRFLTDAQCAVFFVRILQQGKGRSHVVLTEGSLSLSNLLDDELESADATDAVQYEFSTETTYAPHKGIR
jgi:hypothetical protein